MALLTNRYNDKAPKAETYQEIYAHLATMKNEDLEVPLSKLRVDLHNSNILVDDTPYSLSQRAEGMLCARLDIGNIHNMLSRETYHSVETELNEWLKTQEGNLKLKHRNGLIQAVVSDKYHEIPYDESVHVLEAVGARPIRVTTNDALLKVQAIFDSKEFEIGRAHV